jgi:tetratricopeptide (TPR) repeat protein
LRNSEDANNKSLLKKIRKSISTNYEYWALSIETIGDKVFDTKDYKSANKCYEQALSIARKAGNSKLIKQFQKKLNKAPNF